MKNKNIGCSFMIAAFRTGFSQQSFVSQLQTTGIIDADLGLVRARVVRDIVLYSSSK